MIKLQHDIFINSLRPSDAYMRLKTKPSLIKIIPCHLLSELMLIYYKLNPWEHIQ